MNKELISELKELDKQTKVFNLSDEERRKERVNLLHIYNDVKVKKPYLKNVKIKNIISQDGSLRTIQLIAEMKGISIGRVLKEKGIDFDK